MAVVFVAWYGAMDRRGVERTGLFNGLIRWRRWPRSRPDNFSEPLTRTHSLYFTVTVFSTVGFGDITPKTELARLLVTGQMVANVIITGIAVKVILGAARSTRSRTPARQG